MPQTVLVVDDDRSLSEFLKDFLGQRHYQMLTALDGPTALQLIEQQQPALVLLDMKLPGLDGVAVLRHIKAHAPHIRVIIMTSYDEEYERLCKELGVEGFFAKPLSLVALGARIEEVMHSSHNPGPSAQAEIPVIDQWIPQAKLLIVGGHPLRPIWCCIPDQDALRPTETKLDAALVPFAGKYEVEAALLADGALNHLKTFHPDLVLIAADFTDDTRTPKQPRITAAQLIHVMLRSKWKPKEILIFGTQSIPSSAEEPPTPTLTEPDISAFGEEGFIEQAVQVSRILKETCVRLGLVTQRESDFLR